MARYLSLYFVACAFTTLCNQGCKKATNHTESEKDEPEGITLVQGNGNGNVPTTTNEKPVSQHNSQTQS